MYFLNLGIQYCFILLFGLPSTEHLEVLDNCFIIIIFWVNE